MHKSPSSCTPMWLLHMPARTVQKAALARGGRLTEKGQPMDRFLTFSKQTEMKTDQLSCQ